MEERALKENGREMTRRTAARLRPALFGMLLALQALGIATIAAGAGRAADGSDTARASGRVASRVTVRETEWRLSPTRPRARRSGLIQFTAVNRGTVAHSLAIRTSRRTVRTRLIQPGRSARLRLRLRRGRYAMWCPVPGHRQLGMRGTVTVR